MQTERQCLPRQRTEKNKKGNALRKGIRGAFFKRADKIKLKGFRGGFRNAFMAFINEIQHKIYADKGEVE